LPGRVFYFPDPEKGAVMILLTRRWRTFRNEETKDTKPIFGKETIMKKIVALVIVVILVFSLAGCGTAADGSSQASSSAEAAKSFRVGICNYVDDASLNQIVENIRARLDLLGRQNGISFTVDYDNGGADANVISQIIANFQADHVDLMVGVATPTALLMQSAAAGSSTPVVFAAVSDPAGAGLVNSMEAPGANITGTSDALDTETILNMMLAADPEISSVGLLYDLGQDASTAAIAAAKAFLSSRGIRAVEHTGTNVDEIILAAQAMVSDHVDAVFTPSDNTVMQAELSIYEILAEAGIPHYAGADSFALNGAFLGFGVDYAQLGQATADMVFDILVNGADPAATEVKTFDNGIATINTETCKALGLDYDEIAAIFSPFCTKVQPITTAESF